MPNQQIIDYLNQNKDKVSQEQLKKALFDVGYSEADIDEAIKSLEAPKTTPVQSTQPIQPTQSFQSTSSLSRPAKTASPGKKPIIIGAIVLILIGAGVGGYFWWKGRQKTALVIPSAPATSQDKKAGEQISELPSIFPFIEKGIKEAGSEYLAFLSCNPKSSSGKDVFMEFEVPSFEKGEYESVHLYYNLNGSLKDKGSLYTDKFSYGMDAEYFASMTERRKNVKIDLPEALDKATKIKNDKGYKEHVFKDAILYFAPYIKPRKNAYWLITFVNENTNKVFEIDIDAVTGEEIE